MPSFIQRSFAGGEISPAMYGRADQTKYATGLATCRNMIVQRFGSVTNRPGTRFIRAAGNEDKPVRLASFVFGDSDSYVIEMGTLRNDFPPHGSRPPIEGVGMAGRPQWPLRGYFRFYRNGVPLTTFGHDGAWSISESYKTGDYVSHSGRIFYAMQPSTGVEPVALPGGEETHWYSMPEDGTLEIPVVWYTEFAEEVKFSQSGDTVIITCPLMPPRRMVRRNPSQFSIDLEIVTDPPLDAPGGLTVTDEAGPSDPVLTRYVVTSVQAGTFSESLPGEPVASTSVPQNESPHTITWTQLFGDDILEYRIYKEMFGIYGFIGSARGDTFEDPALVPDVSLQPPQRRELSQLLPGPAVSAFFQQRLVFGGGRVGASPTGANFSGNPERMVTSRTGDLYNFSIHNPVQSDDSITLSVAGRQYGSIENLVPLGNSLVILTSSGEFTLSGQGALTPSTISITPESYSGSSSLDALPVQETALFVQARGSIVRDLQYEFSTDGYRGRDLTVYSQHLFDGYTIKDWAYAQTPHSVVWAIRNDGAMLSLTYVREHDVWGWARHDTQGEFESVTTVPEGDEDAVYVVVRRDGRRFIERFTSRQFSEVRDGVFLDCSGTYDGRNYTSTTVQLTADIAMVPGQITYTNPRVEASSGIFAASQVGQGIWIHRDDRMVRCEIIEYVSDTEVMVSTSTDDIGDFINQPTTRWERAVNKLTGIHWLEGKTVGVFGDGNVEGDRVVTGGEIELSRPISVVHVGLRYAADIQTLPLENVQGETYTDKPKRFRKVTVRVRDSRGMKAGPTFDRLREAKIRSDEDYDSPIVPLTGTLDVKLDSGYDMSGQVCIRQDDPIPLTVLAVIPAGVVVNDR